MTRKLIVTRFHLFLVAVLVAVMATALVKVQAGTDLPVHWGFDGKPDRFWPRLPALLMFPVIGVFLTALFALIGRFGPVESIEPGRHMSEALLTGLLGLLCALEFALILIGIGSDLDMIRLICFAIAVFLLLLGGALPRSQRNSITGLRLPWTLKDPAGWRASHLVTGILFAVGGICLGLVTWFRPTPSDMLIALGAAVFLPIILGGLFSFVRSKL
jgi:uncharacterized membrane protein